MNLVVRNFDQLAFPLPCVNDQRRTEHHLTKVGLTGVKVYYGDDGEVAAWFRVSPAPQRREMGCGAAATRVGVLWTKKHGRSGWAGPGTGRRLE